MIPAITEKIEIACAIMIVWINVFLSSRAAMTGITSKAEISKIPTIGIAREIVTADKIIKIVFTTLV